MFGLQVSDDVRIHCRAHHAVSGTGEGAADGGGDSPFLQDTDDLKDDLKEITRHRRILFGPVPVPTSARPAADGPPRESHRDSVAGCG